MIRKTLTFFIFATVFASAQYRYDMVQRHWSLPKLTPIIETNSKQTDPDPFDTDIEFKTIESFDKNQITLWLKQSGVPFPPGSSLTYVETGNGRSSLTVKNKPSNLVLIDHILSQKHPVHTSQQLLKRFLVETKDKPIDELPAIIGKYPAQTLGPLQNIVDALAELDSQLAKKPDEKLKKVIVKRRARIVKMLPESIKTTRSYFSIMVNVMEQ